MGRRLRDPALRHGITGPPLNSEELLVLRSRVTDELLAAATSRRVDIGFVRQLGRVARTIDRRLELIAEREREANGSSVTRRLELAAQTDRPYGGVFK